jgi:hypothetical protein
MLPRGGQDVLEVFGVITNSSKSFSSKWLSNTRHITPQARFEQARQH